MQPVVNRLEEDYNEQMKFVQLDANNEGKQAFEAGNFPGHPSYIIMHTDGKEAWRRSGVLSYEDIETAIQDALR